MMTIGGLRGPIFFSGGVVDGTTGSEVGWSDFEKNCLTLFMLSQIVVGPQFQNNTS